jgi:hypothetical protein
MSSLSVCLGKERGRTHSVDTSPGVAGMVCSVGFDNFAGATPAWIPALFTDEHVCCDGGIGTACNGFLAVVFGTGDVSGASEEQAEETRRHQQK